MFYGRYFKIRLFYRKQRLILDAFYHNDQKRQTEMDSYFEKLKRKKNSK